MKHDYVSPPYPTTQRADSDAKDAIIADLKARLKAIRGHLAHSFSESEESDAAYRATDLRVKKWRKP